MMDGGWMDGSTADGWTAWVYLGAMYKIVLANDKQMTSRVLIVCQWGYLSSPS